MDDYQPRVLTDKFMSELLDSISKIQKQVVINLKANRKLMDKRLGDTSKVTKWNIRDRMLYRFYMEKSHELSPRCLDPVVTVNKSSPTVYQVEIKGKKEAGFKVVPLFPIEELEGPINM